MSAVTVSTAQLKSDIATAHAIASSAGLGVGQMWQDVTLLRALNTTYTNSTGKTIAISVSINGTGYLSIVINSLAPKLLCYSVAGSSDDAGFLLISDGDTYRLSGTANIYDVRELR